MTYLLIRPDSWNLPLFVHVAGAMVVTAALVVTVGSLALAWRATGEERAAITQFGFRTLLYAGIPAYLVMRIGAEWILSRENIPADHEPGMGRHRLRHGRPRRHPHPHRDDPDGRRRAEAPGRRRWGPGEGGHGACEPGRRALRHRDLGDDDQAQLGPARIRGTTCQHEAVHVRFTRINTADQPIDRATIVAEEMLGWLRDMEGFRGLVTLSREGTTLGITFWESRELSDRHLPTRMEFLGRMTSMADVQIEESDDYDVTFAYLAPGAVDALDGERSS